MISLTRQDQVSELLVVWFAQCRHGLWLFAFHVPNVALRAQSVFVGTATQLILRNVKRSGAVAVVVVELASLWLVSLIDGIERSYGRHILFRISFGSELAKRGIIIINPRLS